MCCWKCNPGCRTKVVVAMQTLQDREIGSFTHQSLTQGKGNQKFSP